MQMDGIGYLKSEYVCKDFVGECHTGDTERV